MIRRVAALGACIAAALGAVACGGAPATAPIAPAAHPSTRSHVVLIVMENKEAGQVLGATMRRSCAGSRGAAASRRAATA